MEEISEGSRRGIGFGKNPGGGLRVGHYAGAPVIFTSSWLILGILLIFLFAPIAQRNWPEIGRWSYAVAAVVVLIFGFSTLAHELAHAVTARRMGLRIKSISVTFWGGATQLAQSSPTPRARALISGAGPAANLVLSGLSFAVWRALDPGTILWGLLALLTLVNLFVGILNLFPALPLDGGGILEAAVWAAKKDQYAASRVTAKISRFLGVALAISPLIPMFAGKRPDLIILVWAVILGATVFSSATAALRRPRPREISGEIFRPLLIVDTDTPLDQLPDQIMSLADSSDTPPISAVVVAVRDRSGRVDGWVDPHAVQQVPWPARSRTPASAVSSSLNPAAVFADEPEDTEEWAIALTNLRQRVPGILLPHSARAVNLERLVAELVQPGR